MGANKGMKRINSLPLSSFVISYTVLTGKTTAYMPCKTLTRRSRYEFSTCVLLDTRIAVFSLCVCFFNIFIFFLLLKRHNYNTLQITKYSIP